MLCENFLSDAIQNLEDYFKRLHNYSIPHTIQNQTYVTTFLIRINSIQYFHLQSKSFILSLITQHGYCKPCYCARHRLFGALHLRKMWNVSRLIVNFLFSLQINKLRKVLKSLTELLVFKLCSLIDFTLFIKPVFKRIGRKFGNYKISFSSYTYLKILPVLQQ